MLESALFCSDPFSLPHWLDDNFNWPTGLQTSEKCSWDFLNMKGSWTTWKKTCNVSDISIVFTLLDSVCTCFYRNRWPQIVSVNSWKCLLYSNQNLWFPPSCCKADRLPKLFFNTWFLQQRKLSTFVFSSFNRTNPERWVSHIFMYIAGCGPQREDDLQRCGTLREPNTTSAPDSSVLICDEADHLKDESGRCNTNTAISFFTAA